MTIVTPSASLCSYDIDPSLNVVSVDDGWTQFAVANGAPELVPPAPIGKPVIPDSTDPTTRFLYRELFARSAATGKPATFDLRCDSPAVRRFLQLTITPHGRGFTLKTWLVRTEPHPGGHVLARDAVRDTEALVSFCSWCKRIDASGTWCELDEGLRRLGLFRGERVPMLTHGICAACEERMHRVLDAF